MMPEQIRAYLEESQEALQRFLKEEHNLQAIYDAGELMASAIEGGGKIISCGNGGSMSDAMHFAEELTGRFRNDRPSYAAIAISDPSYLSCVANDYGYENVFSRFIEGMGQQGDVLLAISTSGNSSNVIQAAEVAKQKGMHVVGLTGRSGGDLADLCDVEIRAPRTEFADHAQEIHIKAIHCLIMQIESALGGQE
ncbi:MAG: D-sedoheptulose 7-phosphate isomerase [Flavobacteriales bacterium]|nr:D-sedoheptulose 7-phosphate isomerase [Flavobacteriales bacterium]